ncbi:hypothetical protein OTK49_20940 [Vibrio coralliirubri]|uniref:hypothetical protein n=1 Tax=Vibrio coralliirubri TaxID=1516159 RepID=UPI0022844DE8|nr:hypothetical protein [Vibrio coralliirubri]MCY9864986.1 hypothetical protein [Vibrio coralliirubri]
MAPLTKKEKDWFTKLESVLGDAPKSLRGKVCGYTIGDYTVTIFDEKKTDEYVDEHGDDSDRCSQVQNADSELLTLKFPFDIESTAG